MSAPCSDPWSLGLYDSRVKTRATFRGAILAIAAATLAGCTSVSPSPAESPAETPTSDASLPTSASSSPVATPTPTPPSSFPLAVVTGLTNLKGSVTLDELEAVAAGGRLVMPCGVEVQRPALDTTTSCRMADRIAAFLEAHQH